MTTQRPTEESHLLYFCQKTGFKKSEKRETATDNKTYKPQFFRVKNEKPTYKMAKTENPKAPPLAVTEQLKGILKPH